MQKVFPGILLVFVLIVLTLFSDMVGTTFRKMRNATGPSTVESVPAATGAYKPALLDGSIMPH